MWCWNHIPSVLIMEEKSQSNIWILEKEISGEQSKSCLAKTGLSYIHFSYHKRLFSRKRSDIPNQNKGRDKQIWRRAVVIGGNGKRMALRGCPPLFNACCMRKMWCRSPTHAGQLAGTAPFRRAPLRSATLAWGPDRARRLGCWRRPPPGSAPPVERHPFQRHHPSLCRRIAHPPRLP